MAGFGLRKNQRFKDSVPVQFRGKGVVGEGMLKDLSLTGASISGDVHVSVGMTLGLQLFFPGDREPLLIDRAAVQWVKGMEFGVELTARPQIAERLTRLISEKVKKNTDHPRTSPPLRARRGFAFRPVVLPPIARPSKG